MKLEDVLPIVISAVAITVAIISEMRTRRLERGLNAPQLEIEVRDGPRTGFWPSDFRDDPEEAKRQVSFKYRAHLKNLGNHNIHIDLILLEYGNKDDQNQRRRKVLASDFYLTPSEPFLIETTISASDVIAIADQLGFSEDACNYALIITYFDVYGHKREVYRDYGTRTHFIAHRGPILHAPRSTPITERVSTSVRAWLGRLRRH